MTNRAYATDLKALILNSWNNSQRAFESHIGTPYYSLPLIEPLEWHLVGEPDKHNYVVAEKGFDWRANRQITFGSDAQHCVIVFGTGCRAKGKFWQNGTGHLVILGEESVRTGSINITVEGSNNLAFVGAQTECIAANLFLNGDDTNIVIGDNCLASFGVYVRNNDDHAIVDMATGGWVNQPASILVEPSVWLCPDASVLKGTTIGLGSVVAARSVVTTDVPRFSLAGGIPAKVLRHGITWNRPFRPTSNLVQRMTERAEQVVP